MKIKEVMSPNPDCCTPGDSAQMAARIMRDGNIGSIPVVIDQQSRELVGVITDRDLCCSIVADGLDPKMTPIQKCERAMQEHQIRRIPIVDSDNRVIGIVAQADLALKDKPEKVSKTVAEISKLSRPSVAA